MFSRTVSSRSSESSCGTTPSRPRIATPSFAGSSPKTRSSPSVTGETQPIIRIVDVFPAPFGPRKPNASPRWSVEVDRVDRRELAEALDEAAGVDQGIPAVRLHGEYVSHAPGRTAARVLSTSAAI